MDTGKTKSIELWRLIFSFSIVLCHAATLSWNKRFHFSSLGVEFFFVLSGFLMAKSAHGKGDAKEKLGTETVSFLLRKLKVIYPTFLFAVLLEFAAQILLRTSNPGQPYVYLWDLLFLRITGLGGVHLLAVGASWYLFAMFPAMWILYPLLRRFPDMFYNVIAPLTAVLILGWFSITYGSINHSMEFENGISMGLLRAIAELCAGCVSFYVCERVKLTGNKKINLFFWTFLEIVPLSGVFLISAFRYRSQTDFICILLVGIGLCAAFSGKSYVSVILQRINLKWASAFSLALYLNHVVWLRTLNDWKMARPFEWQLSVLIGLSIITAITCIYSCNLARQIFYRIRKKQK